MERSGDTRTALAEGRRLFNAGRFFEAHEVWEAAWLREEGEMRRLLQGLIQIAAGYHHAFDRHQAPGCVRLLRAGWERLRPLDAAAAGLALETFRDAVAASLTKALAWERGETESLSRREAPQLRLSKA